MFFKSLKQVRENKEGEELKKVSTASDLIVTEVCVLMGIPWKGGEVNCRRNNNYDFPTGVAKVERGDR